MRGLHIAIFDPERGLILFAKAFDLYKRKDTFDDFIRRPLPDGLVVIAACKDDIFTSLSKAAKAWFVKMGSKEIESMEYR